MTNEGARDQERPMIRRSAHPKRQSVVTRARMCCPPETTPHGSGCERTTSKTAKRRLRRIGGRFGRGEDEFLEHLANLIKLLYRNDPTCGYVVDRVVGS